MPITTVLFDLDGTLLPMELETFTRAYFSLLAEKLASHGYEPKALIDTIWAGTAAMVKNDGSFTNEEAFWKVFTSVYGEKARADEPVFNEFYASDFQKARAACGFTEKAAGTVAAIRAMGLRTALATNPIFPAVATESRIRWAGLQPEDFEIYTTYENSVHCKPNPAYFQDVIDALGVRADECLMVGNDATEDLAAAKLGMRVFLVTDCLINRHNADLSGCPCGSFDDLLAYLRSLS